MNIMSRFFVVAISVFLTADLASSQWVLTSCPVNTFDGIFQDGFISTFASLDSNLFAVGPPDNLFLSTDNGLNWVSINNGLFKNTAYPSIALLNNNIFVSTYLIFRSTNGGTSWAACDSGLTNPNITVIATDGSNLFAGSNGQGVFFSKDSGTTWNQLSATVFPTQYSGKPVWVSAFAFDDSNIFIGTYGSGLWRLKKEGANWTSSSLSLRDAYVHALAISGSRIFAANGNDGVYVSNDGGTSWNPSNNGLGNVYARCISVTDSTIFVGMDNGVFLSTNDGATWTSVTDGLTDTRVFQLTIHGTTLFAGTIVGGVYARPLSNMITGVHDNTNSVITKFTLAQNYPNPFNPTTVIRYYLPLASFVTLKVFDMLGREVQSLVHQDESVGGHTITFNGSFLPSGLYFYRLQAGRFVSTKDMVLLK